MDEINNLRECKAKLECQVKDLEAERRELIEAVDKYKAKADALELRLDNMRNEYYALMGENKAFRFCFESLRQ